MNVLTAVCGAIQRGGRSIHHWPDRQNVRAGSQLRQIGRISLDPDNAVGISTAQRSASRIGNAGGFCASSDELTAADGAGLGQLCGHVGDA